jgi:hypothetical protein
MSSTDKAIRRWEVIAIAAAIIELLYVFVEVARGSQSALPDAQPTSALQWHEDELPSFAVFAGGSSTRAVDLHRCERVVRVVVPFDKTDADESAKVQVVICAKD